MQINPTDKDLCKNVYEIVPDSPTPYPWAALSNVAPKSTDWQGVPGGTVEQRNQTNATSAG